VNSKELDKMMPGNIFAILDNFIVPPYIVFVVVFLFKPLSL